MEDTALNEIASNDSDEDIDFTARKKHGKQALRIDETDSEDEVVDTPPEDPVETNGFGSNSDENSDESKESSDDDDRNATTTPRKKKRTKKKSDEREIADNEHKSKISALCDGESSSDESDRHVPETVTTKKTDRAPQRMSAKQAEEQMKLIQSESQRLARQCHLSVPYHKPKQHSLKDFLNRRTINRPVPMALTKKAAATIKMSQEELEQYAKSLEDRNKESQEFYRSESDDTNNDDDNETKSKSDEQTGSEETLVDLAVVAKDAAEPMEATCNDAESTQIDSVSEKPNDVEVAQPIDTVKDVIDLTKILNGAADLCNVEMESPKRHPAGVSSEDVIVTAANAVDSQETEAKSNEPIEIDYNFGETERNEAKTLKDILPFYSNIKPCLKGPVNGVINLDDDVSPTKTGGDELMARFIKHVVLKPNRPAKEISILSAENGVIELNNVKIESDEANCIYSKPRKDVFKLKQELSLRIAAKRKEELQKKQMPTIKIPLEDSDSDCEIQADKGKEIENSVGNNKLNSDEEIEKENIGGNGDEEEAEDIEMNNGNDSNSASDDNDGSDEEDDEAAEDEAAEDEEIQSVSDGCELVQKTKPRKRIILMDNSDDDDETGQQEDSIKSADLNTTSISLDLGLDENQFAPEDPVDKTMSQISKNQSRADQMIDSCGKIIPFGDSEQNETDNNLSTLFTQTADSMSVTELLDLCSGSFVTQATNGNFVETVPDPSFGTQANNFSENEFSDDEIGLPKRSKQRKKINISDDEEQDNEDTNIRENDDASEDDDNHESNAETDNLSEDEEAVEKIVEYDSEENEIEVPVVQKKKISDFFENEAELSESEWGSADEDERNLDKFEMELGDEDEFDQNQLMSELDRIHRRRMLDQDAREVKIIKDTHFEDEEESGLGRQRQYRWKHMENSLNLDENQRNGDVDGNENAKSDDETEETWRRMRHERNNILQETKAQNETINDSKLVLTTKTKKRISIVKTTANLNTSATKDLSFLISKMKEEQTHRSSLLIRDEQTLANLAKMSTEDGGIPSVNTNSKNFLFNVISTDDDKPLGKRKLDDDGTDGDSKNRKTTKKMKKSTLSVLDKLM
ncbi:claspin [Bradysia coprophila]|uniref:claspin n=1 Tax=Bradysia coprophila TaxID=38358 RepID=UPI00187D8321|nr:claspin [Bradysia coprophila]